MKRVIVVISQKVEAIVEMLNFLGKPAEPLPQAVQLTGMILVLSGKRDVYYTVTTCTCSCSSSIYRPGKPCKHQRKYFPGPKKSQAEIEKESDEELARLHKAKWAGFNGPRKPSENPVVSSLMLIDAYAPITTEEEIRYWAEDGREAGSVGLKHGLRCLFPG